MLRHDLAKLYRAAPKVLVQAVKRNLERFPSDFMFQLENQELTNLKSQVVTSSWGDNRKLPYALGKTLFSRRKVVIVKLEFTPNSKSPLSK
jgi:hypothetical protein